MSTYGDTLDELEYKCRPNGIDFFSANPGEHVTNYHHLISRKTQKEVRHFIFVFL